MTPNDALAAICVAFSKLFPGSAMWRTEKLTREEWDEIKDLLDIVYFANVPAKGETK